MAKSNFIVRGGGDFSGIYKEISKTQKKLGTFQKGINKTMKFIGIALSGIAIGKLIKDSTKVAMGVESAMDNVARNMGDSSKSFNHWAQTQSKALGMARADAFKYGSTFSNLLSSFTANSKETADQTQELMKAAAIISSKTGKTYEDTAERIRSGMLGSTEAIEDLGIYTNISMIESTEAFKKFANGKSWSQLDFQVQQQIRLAAILEQTYKRYGDTLADTTQIRQAQFIASLKNIQLLLGQVFLPIWNAVLPALTAMANAIERVMGVLAAFTQALFGKATKVQTKETQAQSGAVADLGDATEKAGKQAKGALAGFDEINSLSMNEGVGGEIVGGTGGGGISTEDVVSEVDDGTGGMMENVSTKATEMAEKVKAAFTNMKNAIVENKDIIIPSLGAITGAIAGLAIYSGVIAIIDFFKKFGAAVKLAWAFLAAHPIYIVVAAIGALIGAFVSAYKTNDEFRAKVDKLWATIKTSLTPVIEKLGEGLKWVWQNVMVPMGQFIGNAFIKTFEALGGIAQWLWRNAIEPLGNGLIWLWQQVIVPLGKIIGDVFKLELEKLGSMAKSVWENIMKPFGSFLKTVFVESVKAVIDIMKYWWDNILKPLGTFISGTFKPIIEALIKVFEFLWNNVFKPLVQFMNTIFINTFNTVTNVIGVRIKALETVFRGLITFITGIFTNDWGKAWEGVKLIFSGIVGSLEGVFKGVINGIVGIANSFIKFWNKIELKVPQVSIPFVGTFGGFSIGVPKINEIPMLAKGGITNGPMMAIIGDNPGGKEVVSPLDDLMGMITSAVGTAMMASNQFTSTSGSNGDIILQVDGTTFARIIGPYADKEKGRIGNNVIIKPV